MAACHYDDSLDVVKALIERNAVQGGSEGGGRGGGMWQGSGAVLLR